MLKLDEDLTTLQENFQKRLDILSEDSIYLESLSLCESLVNYYLLAESQLKLIESEKDLKVKWTLLDSSKSLIKTLDRRLAKLIPNAEKEINFWMDQPFDYDHKMLILNNAEDLNFSLKNIQTRFEKQFEMLSDEEEDELQLEDTILKLSNAQFELEKNIERANKAARQYYLNENKELTKQEKRKILKEYVNFKRKLKIV